MAGEERGIIKKARANLKIEEEIERGMSILNKGMGVVILRGRHAGKKGVIIEVHNQKNDDLNNHPHVLVVGVEGTPKRITGKTSDYQKQKRTTVRPFVKIMNQNHILPTRYTLDLKLDEGFISLEKVLDPSQKKTTKTRLREIMTNDYLQGRNQWLYRKLKF